ncbi:uncharacterized protein C1orf198 homolog [Megalops cyprinoides]|uniref:uncharacterized protein C1orf198 homolog n=1 Tax=Megalops cyprinoides TaxID=118141 RepID=UPI001864C71B|nr:uncharacterized protein C1orf198 homolog [Megalops cyprinoides]
MATATMVGTGSDAHRMEAKKFEYFSSINSMARKIMLEREKIKEKYGSNWEKMTPNEQDTAIDNGMMDPQVRARYAMHRLDREEIVCYPKMLIQTGQKIVHFGEEDITWQDEHSAPFSWETKSQLEFSLSSTAAPEQGGLSLQSDSKPSKTPQSNQAKVSQSSKVSNGEEESSFWKISAERSRLEGEQADFHSLTPSQIKSLEKGEKPLPSYLRQESAPREVEEPAPQQQPQQRATKPRAPKPPAPPPPVPVSTHAPPAAISVTPPAPASVSTSVAGWERAQSTLPSVSTLDDVFTPAPTTKSPAHSGGPSKESEKAESPLAASPTFSQFNTSSSILKTGFDFLDNW